METVERAIEFLSSLGAYNTTPGNQERLDMAKMVQASHLFELRQYVFPGTDKTIPGTINNIRALENYEDTLVTIPGSIIIQIGGYSTVNNGFRFSLYEVGSQQDIMYRMMTRGEMAGSMISMTPSVTPPSGRGIIDNEPVGNRWMVEPLIILKPGRVNVRIVNIAPADTFIQLVIDVAVPISAKSLGQQVTRVPLMDRLVAA